MFDDCSIEKLASNKKVCTSCEHNIIDCKNSDDNSLCSDNNASISDDNNDSSSNNTKNNEVIQFEAGDHITLQCNAAGIPYDHHAIVLSISTRSDGEGTLCVADFTAGDTGNAIRGTSGSDIVNSGSFGSGSESDEDHGLRVLVVDSKEWKKVDYSSRQPVDPVHIIRRRVEFLLKYPHYIPTYSLVESNCECVAVWCMTGEWKTFQTQTILGNVNLGSRLALAGISIASLGSLTIPFGLVFTAGEVISGVWGDHAKRKWKEQTEKLNKEFDNSIKVEEKEGTKKSTSSSSSFVGNPFSDTRNLRDMVNAYQKADAILSMVDQAPSMKLDDNNNEKILGTDTDIRIIS